ncbi:hypothetical protein MMC11_005829 [Xylographa trunciseda]|nr:hypothetical protein [Xylographa trunciseda]
MEIRWRNGGYTDGDEGVDDPFPATGPASDTKIGRGRNAVARGASNEMKAVLRGKRAVPRKKASSATTSTRARKNPPDRSVGPKAKGESKRGQTWEKTATLKPTAWAKTEDKRKRLPSRPGEEPESSTVDRNRRAGPMKARQPTAPLVQHKTIWYTAYEPESKDVGAAVCWKIHYPFAVQRLFSRP